MWVTGAKLMGGWFVKGARFTFTKEESVTVWKSLAYAYDFIGCCLPH